MEVVKASLGFVRMAMASAAAPLGGHSSETAPKGWSPGLVEDSKTGAIQETPEMRTIGTRLLSERMDGGCHRPHVLFSMISFFVSSLTHCSMPCIGRGRSLPAQRRCVHATFLARKEVQGGRGPQVRQ